MTVDSAPAIATTEPTSGVDSDTLGTVGAPDWALGWSFGVDPANRAQPLWFEDVAVAP